MAFTPHSTSKLQSEINVTPLVDVMLVLLVVFIVTAPLLTNAVPVNLQNRGHRPARHAAAAGREYRR
ncbi:MAG: biopolymer transporter ExbD [Symbiopectobacterium sp.]|uniref:biopolymer transporter ExbD n=1 Tax=Symbiopectobacterium sp. TaxID=2952789 RepID=UPI0039E9F2DE